MFFEIKESKIWFDGQVKATYEAILDNIGTMPGDVVYLAGSLIEGYLDELSNGMGNPYSDIDVFIIRDHEKYIKTEAEYIHNVNKIYFCCVGDLELDVEIFDRQYIDSLTEALDSIVFDKDVRILNILKQRLPIGNDYGFVNSFLNRLYYSICISNEESYKHIKDKINYEKFLELKKYHISGFIDNRIEDVKGNLLVGAIEPALDTLRSVMQSLMEIALATEGIFVDRQKWIALKLVNYFKATRKHEKIYELYIEIFRGNFSNDINSLDKIATFLSIIENELEKILLGELSI